MIWIEYINNIAGQIHESCASLHVGQDRKLQLSICNLMFLRSSPESDDLAAEKVFRKVVRSADFRSFKFQTHAALKQAFFGGHAALPGVASDKSSCSQGKRATGRGCKL